jgi:hypothetical protein
MQDPLLRLHCIPLSMLGCVLSSMLLRRGDLLGFRQKPILERVHTLEGIATPRENTPMFRNDSHNDYCL